MIGSIITTMIGVAALAASLLFAFMTGMETEKVSRGDPKRLNKVNAPSTPLIISVSLAATAVLLLLVRP